MIILAVTLPRVIAALAIDPAINLLQIQLVRLLKKEDPSANREGLTQTARLKSTVTWFMLTWTIIQNMMPFRMFGGQRSHIFLYGKPFTITPNLHEALRHIPPKSSIYG
jgi:hypothetical protein